MAEATYRPATEEDAHALARNMRPADVRECAALDSDPLCSALSGLRDSEHCWALDIDGQLAAVFGVVTDPESPGVGGVWLLGTDLATRHKRRFTLAIGDIVEQLQERYPVLANAVHTKNTDAVKWLKFAGFTLMDPEPTPPYGEPFSVFYKARANV